MTNQEIRRAVVAGAVVGAVCMALVGLADVLVNGDRGILIPVWAVIGAPIGVLCTLGASRVGEWGYRDKVQPAFGTKIAAMIVCLTVVGFVLVLDRSALGRLGIDA